VKKSSKIYVAGHSGLIGSAIVRNLKTSGYPRILTKTHKALDLADRKKVDQYFSKIRPEYVVLCAARVGGIKANDTYPAEFILQNLTIQNNVIDLAWKYRVKKLLFLVSSCVYPKKCAQPMCEGSLLTGPLEPTNEPYAIAKLAGIRMCQAYNRQYGTQFISVIPANVYGINDHFDENGHVLAALINKFHHAFVNNLTKVTIWGTGKPKREFFYVDDLAEACILLLKKKKFPEVINVGIGQETSIYQLAQKIKKISGFKGDLVFDKSFPDGNPRRLVDSENFSKMGWKAKTSLDEGLQLTWDWYMKNVARKK
jgi:GDP-L-fucose synthase